KCSDPPRAIRIDFPPTVRFDRRVGYLDSTKHTRHDQRAAGTRSSSDHRIARVACSVAPSAARVARLDGGTSHRDSETIRCASHVKQTGVGFQLHDSKIVAIPWPPPMHIVARP